MLAQIAEYVRTQTIAVATISAPIDRSYVAPGDRWSVESCRQWVIHFAGSRREALGGQRVPAPQQGVGFPGPLASAPVHDLDGGTAKVSWPLSIQATAG
jgi:hypothetical protein